MMDCCNSSSSSGGGSKMKGRLRNVGAHSEQARVWFLRLLSSIVVWTVISHLSSLPLILRHPIYLTDGWPTPCIGFLRRNDSGALAVASEHYVSPPSPSSFPPSRIYKSNGYLRVSCNGGLNQMRAAICDMVTIARFLNLTLLIPELDKTSFWADPSDFKDIFNVRHFINSLRDEVKIVKSLPKKFNQWSNTSIFSMPPVSWSNEKYYLKEILPLIRKYKVIHFNKTDARLANNGLPVALQKLRCRVNYEALKFTPQIEAMGNKLISILQNSGFFIVLHLRYEMDMLAFSGCTHGCSESETDELTRMRYSYRWWKEKEIVSEKKRLEGQCPLTPEETALVLQALGIERNTLIYIASGEIYDGERRLAALRAVYPKIVRKELLLSQDDLKSFQNHSTQMAALDYMVSVASNVFVPTYYGNMAKVVEGHRRYLGFRRTIQLERKGLVELLDLYQNSTISWDDFAYAVRDLHMHLMGQPTRRKAIRLRPKEEDYFYANPQECLGPLSPESRVAIT